MKNQPQSKKKGNLIIILVVAIIIIAGLITYIVYIEHNKSTQSTVLSGDITQNPALFPPTLIFTLNNPSKLTDPYNVTMTLDLPDGQSVAMGYYSLNVWRYGDFSAIVNIQSDSVTDFVISTGTEIALDNTANSNYNFNGTTFILTYAGYSGAITYYIG